MLAQYIKSSSEESKLRVVTSLHIVHTSIEQYYNKLHLPTKSFQLLLHSRQLRLTSIQTVRHLQASEYFNLRTQQTPLYHLLHMQAT